MKRPLKNLCFAALAAVAFISLDSVLAAPLSLSMYIALLYLGVPPLPLAVVYTASSLTGGSMVAAVSAAVQALLLGILFLIYAKKKRRPGVEIVIYVFISSIVYLLFDDRAEIVYKLVYMAVISLFSVVCTIAAQAVSTKGATIKFDKGELVCASVCALVISVGSIKVCGADLFKGLSAFAILASVCFFDDETPAFLASALCGAFVWAQGKATYFLPYFCYYFAAYSFIKTSRIIAALAICATEALFAFVIGFYGEYGYVQALLFAVPSILFALLPQKLVEQKNGNGYLSVEEAITKNSLNAYRRLTAARLSETADGFAQMNYAVTSLSTKAPSDDILSSRIAQEVVRSCGSCENYNKCATFLESARELERIAKIGIAKKRVTLIDLPKSFLDFCRFPNNVIFEVNRLIDGFSRINEESEKSEKIKSALSVLAKGMENSVSDLADEFQSVYLSDAATEKKLIKDFKRNGVKTKGLMLKSREGFAEVTLLFDKRAFNEKVALKVLKDTFSYDFKKVFDTELQGTSVAATYFKKPKLSCAYGVGAVTKSTSPKSGDMHSVVRLDNGKILVALSDGMGSGEGASATSVSSIELIEAFYKAGFGSKTVLPLVNRILSSITEDDFSAVDICILDENNGDADFLKIGAPYGFILSKEGIRYLEGSSLPIGILDVLTPTVASTSLSRGDIVILLSDGVTDAFTSSSDVIEYLKSAPVFNPQELADDIIRKALSLSGGVAADDMTALCVRVC